VRTTLAIVFLAISLTMMPGQSTMPGYLLQRKFSLAPAAAMGSGLYGFDNPAVLNYLHQPDIYFTWIDTTGKVFDVEDWGLFAAVPNLSFGMMRHENALGRVYDYRISHSFGSRKISLGLGFGWSSGDVNILERSNVVSLGTLIRPDRHLSMGLTGLLALSGGNREATAELGLRPLGNELMTLFGDFNIQRGIELKDGCWSAGLALEPLPGVRLTARYFDDKTFNAGVHLSLGRSGLQSMTHFNEDREAVNGVYGIRLGANDRALLNPRTAKRSTYLKLDLNGPLRYRRFVMFDRANTLREILEAIRAAQADNSIAGIAINTSGMCADVELLWEVRAQLADFKAAGKHVVIYIDNAGTVDYYFASVADRVVMDPIGMIDLRGLMMGRTYLKGSFEKLGIGFDEWRFFKYKSAAETFSRESMSDADREQRQAIVDDIYDVIRSDVSRSRGFTPQRFDDLVNNTAIFMAKTARDNGLVDTLGRWDAVEDAVKSLEGKKKTFIAPSQLSCYNLPEDNIWGGKPKLAIVYGLGACAMDEGITARQLVKDVEAVTKDKSIKAVVFRVDSPGGDALASDIVAEAFKKCAGKKPVIVSQGLVAGSGGYWLSMYGTRIVAAPVTITGSIGVIGGWLYDQGFKSKLGLSTDKVQAGKHADMEFGATLPLIGASIPDRNLTEEERGRMETEIKNMYAEFVRKVADARKKSYGEIETIAQGRVWSGIDGKDVGIVDTLGGMELALSIAKQLAGIADWTGVEIVEYPKPGLFSPDFFKPQLISMDEKTKKNIGLVRFYLDHNGQPIPMMPMEYQDLTIE
jgi:protease-4